MKENGYGYLVEFNEDERTSPLAPKPCARHLSRIFLLVYLLAFGSCRRGLKSAVLQSLLLFLEREST